MKSICTRVAAATSLLMTGLLSPAAAGGNELSQAVSVTARVDIPYQFVQFCLNDDCEDILLTGVSRELTLDLSYVLAASGHLPTVTTDVGTPAVCEIRNPDGSITKRLGASIFASGATFGDKSSVRLSDGGKPVKQKTSSPGRPTKTDSVGASVCVLKSSP